MRNFLSRLGRDQQGTAIVELGLSFTFLAVLIMGVADVSTAFSRKLALEQGAQRAIEKQMQTTGEETPEGTIQGEAAVQAGVDPSQVEVDYVRLCNGVAQSVYEGNCPSGEVKANYLTVMVSDNYRPLFPFLGMGAKQADGTYLVRAKAGMRTQ